MNNFEQLIYEEYSKLSPEEFSDEIQEDIMNDEELELAYAHFGMSHRAENPDRGIYTQKDMKAAFNAGYMHAENKHGIKESSKFTDFSTKEAKQARHKLRVDKRQNDSKKKHRKPTKTTTNVHLNVAAQDGDKGGFRSMGASGSTRGSTYNPRLA